jgi:hypothetical protein
MKRDCDICDVCLERQGKDNPNETFERIAGKITRTLRSGPVRIQQLDLLFSESAGKVVDVLRAMAENGEVLIKDDTIQLNGNNT